MKLTSTVLLLLFLACGMTTATAECKQEWKNATAWGHVDAAGSKVSLYVKESPENGFVSIPRLNNRLKTVKAEGYEGELKFVPEIDHWRIFVPEDLSLPATIEVELVEAIRLCDQPLMVKPTAEGKLILPAHHAETKGDKLRFEPQPHKNTIGYWTVPSDTATWHFEVGKLSDFDVIVHQGCGKGQGGSDVEFTVTSLSDTSSQSFPLKIQDTGHFQNFVPRSIGHIKLAPGKYTLTVSCKSLAKNAVCDIRQVVLQN
ncbi:hypothetical protein ACMFWY_09205 [Roseiconus sp. JC912]